MCAPYTNLEKPLENYSMLCRGCLAEAEDMKNIFEWGLAEDFSRVTDIQLKESDSISVLLCTVCEDMLLACKQFRLQCQKSDLLLTNTAKKKKPPNSSNVSDGQNDTGSQQNHISCLLFDKKLVIMIVAPNMTSKIYLSCPYCQENYIKQKDLLAHLVRLHNVNGDDFKIELQYHCWVDSCYYHLNSGKNKYFQSRKYLNQHHIKVHMEKAFHCIQCSQNFATETLLKLHFKTCNVTFICEVCNNKYRDNEKLLVHLMRKHPDVHKKYKEQKRNLKRKVKIETETKRTKINEKLDFVCDSPKRSFATQTLTAGDTVKNDVTLPSWQTAPKMSTYKQTDVYETKTDEISTQTVFEDLLSLKSQNSEDESSIFFSETVSLSDIQTQTFPLEFGLSRSNKETITSETQSPDLSIKETQTCFCLYDSPRMNLRLFDSVSSSPSSINLTSAETQTSELRSTVKSDVMLSFSSAQTQTSFEDSL